jgi:hypothetical protein
MNGLGDGVSEELRHDDGGWRWDWCHGSEMGFSFVAV